MKKLVFTFLTMVVFAFVANTTFAQTSTTPYLGATYTYSVADIEPGSANLVEVYISSDAAGANAVTVASDYEIITSTGATLTSTGGQGYRGALSAANISFDILYPGTSTLATDGTTYYLWVKVYSGDETTCSNFKYIEIEPAANDFDLAITAEADKCQAVAIPTSENVMASDGQTTTFEYTIVRTGGTSSQQWSFDLTLDDVDMTYDVTTNTVALDDVTDASTETYDTGTGVLNVQVNSAVTSVTVTFSITTTPGAPDNTFTATLTNEKLLNDAGTSTLYTVPDPSGDSDAIILQQVPFIGTFQGVD